MKKMLLAGCLIFLGCGTQQNVYLKDIGQSEKITLEAEAAMPKTSSRIAAMLMAWPL